MLAGEAAESPFASDPGGLQVDDFHGGLIRAGVGNALGDALVWTGGVVVGGELGQDRVQMRLVDQVAALRCTCPRPAAGARTATSRE